LHRAVDLAFDSFSGSSVLLLTVDGDTTTFQKIGSLLFRHYLRARLGEELHAHLWAFRIGGIAAHPKIPILSGDLQSYNYLYDADPDPSAVAPGVLAPGQRHLSLDVGARVQFHYDEGSPTTLILHIKGIYEVLLNINGL
jgi:hypothetical protein